MAGAELLDIIGLSEIDRRNRFYDRRRNPAANRGAEPVAAYSAVRPEAMLRPKERELASARLVADRLLERYRATSGERPVDFSPNPLSSRSRMDLLASPRG
ncbi:hypothetical protein BB31_30720 [Amycolatopsis lurida NRRL 2430]|uniref:Uncharacterized protein n=1 Tax=Amycolatopsis lurida NRRL 2430 TaxID=1460371 RepID=A0A2P2FKV5_AMYLU|nr:hypothetical protein BB31_30720 [Amycolatopsis lurida NRRL 2430]